MGLGDLVKSIGDKIDNKKIISIGYMDGTDLFYELEDKTIVYEKKLINEQMNVDSGFLLVKC